MAERKKPSEEKKNAIITINTSIATTPTIKARIEEACACSFNDRSVNKTTQMLLMEKLKKPKGMSAEEYYVKEIYIPYVKKMERLQRLLKKDE